MQIQISQKKTIPTTTPTTAMVNFTAMVEQWKKEETTTDQLDMFAPVQVALSALSAAAPPPPQVDMFAPIQLALSVLGENPPPSAPFKQEEGEEDPGLIIDFKEESDNDTLAVPHTESMMDLVEERKKQVPTPPPTFFHLDVEPKQQQQTVVVPLIEYLCALMACDRKELQVLLMSNIQSRRHMLTHLRTTHLQTTHLQEGKNITLHAHDLSAQNANMAFACGGYLNITVRQYYYVKHARRLVHPYLPCMIEFGGGTHASYYPLELIGVQVASPADKKTPCGCN